MTHIDSNQHGPQLLHAIRKLHPEQVTTDLTIDLLQHIACLRKIEILRGVKVDDL